IRFARSFNIEIQLHLYLESLEVEPAISVLEEAESDSLDELGIFHVFSKPSEALKTALAELSAHPVVKNPKIRFGNFPFCFFPADRFKLTYRDVVEPVKGLIGSQRDLIKEVRGRKPAGHTSCVSCRSRNACCAFTEIEDHPEYGPFLEPRTESSLVFSGGSLAGTKAPADDSEVWVEPAEQGDMVAAVMDGFETLLIIDGYFYTRFPCTTFEVMLALEQGINVFGSSSMGALRAVELDRFGMIGVGFVFDYLKARPIKPYHVVAQTYDDLDRPISTPLIEILFFLRSAVEEGLLFEDEFEAARDAADRIHFTEVSFERFFDQVPFGEETVANLKRFWDEIDTDIKKRDALELLETYKAKRDTDRVREIFRSVRNQSLKVLFEKYSGDPDLSLPDDWNEAGDGAEVGRDLRAVPPEETRGRAERFFEDLTITVADTSKYDDSGQFILSVFFVPFYFMDYYPSSATGNGDDFEEALTSAWMELVERAPACGLHIRQEPRDEWAGPFFPVNRLPQVENWGMQEAVKQHAAETHGYARVTDMVSGERFVVPRFVTMFAYSGTDGLA
ncbi:MAG: TfuA-like protein, partial [Verrucomicrobiota bacterium]